MFRASKQGVNAGEALGTAGVTLAAEGLVRQVATTNDRIRTENPSACLGMTRVPVVQCTESRTRVPTGRRRRLGIAVRVFAVSGGGMTDLAERQAYMRTVSLAHVQLCPLAERVVRAHLFRMDSHWRCHERRGFER